jgi:hypothetical protein
MTWGGAHGFSAYGNGHCRCEVCKAAWAAYMRSYRDDPVRRARNKARTALGYAVRAGKVLRGPCEECGARPTQAHHDDYSDPLKVRWLCRLHHQAISPRGTGRMAL